ncbi:MULTISPECIES: two-component system sensor histidine kinase NtrB [Methylobacterium]|jgi:signal transduction histidine kinase|uniref:histidine kinase n=1 Tax=Methylobacterium longum TaxID=767694 RepID=A0ABT8AZL5_9HYPH|nr:MULTISPECIES: ATP-binding protein [Methylobacterium]MCJ2098221.1 ATP-binding protein [Methylobacterium sp. E-046]MDN3574895.1 ATP-binding protein [Methylobacterium longum]GJE13093.1 Blue-light-activated protein [Methylobacterium longum]
MAQPGTGHGSDDDVPLSEEARALLDALPTPSLLFDEGGRVLHANPALERLCGRPAAWLREHGLDPMLASRAPAPDPAQDAIQEFPALRADGTSFWASLTVAPLPTTPFRIGQILDVTARREAEGALALSRQREALGLLTNSVAHEFNNFLQILIGYIDGLKRRLGDRPEPFIQRAISRSADATERAAILTRHLLAYSRRIAPEVRAVDLDVIVADLAGRLAPDLPAAIRLNVARTPGLPPAISNPTQIEFALRHLVANACEAMPAGGTLTLSTFRIEPGDRMMQQPGDGIVGIAVSDTGQGMSPEMLTRALAPFQTSHEAGRGAGLAIVHGLMKRQNGTITVDSRSGEGTQVRLSFPAAPERALH